MKSKLGWKVPFRQWYTESFGSMLRSAFWCHVVMRVFPCAYDFGTDALAESYVDGSVPMGSQLEFLARDATDRRRAAMSVK